MIDEDEIETYLSISTNKYGIYLFDKKNFKNLYSKELQFNEETSINIHKLSKFLDDNIFKIEKLIGNFIKNIFLVIKDDRILNLNIGIKKKNYNQKIDQKYIEAILTELKDHFVENYREQKIMHILINAIYINEKKFLSFQNNLEGKSLSLEVKFISINDNIVYEIEKTLEKFQIKIVKYADQNYINNYFHDKDIHFSEMISRIISGCNENEIILSPKLLKNKGFFERFFQLFS